MAIELNGVKQMDASDKFTVEAGKRLTIETSPSGQEILNAEVPAGTKWEVSISIEVKEIPV